MSGWNFDISQAPKGATVQKERIIDGKTRVVYVHEPELIIAAGSGGVVTISKWLPDQGRWNFFAKAVPPLAWMSWPDHPEKEATQ